MSDRPVDVLSEPLPFDLSSHGLPLFASHHRRLSHDDPRSACDTCRLLATIDELDRAARAARSATPSSEEDGLREALAEDAALLHHYVHPDVSFEECDGARCVRRRTALAATPDGAGRSPIDVERLHEAADIAVHLLGNWLWNEDGALDEWPEDAFDTLRAAGADLDRGEAAYNARRLSESTGSASSEEPDR